MTINKNPPKERILLIGGAGFIGIHTAKLFKAHGHQVALVDNFASSIQDAITEQFKIYQIDACDLPGLEAVYAEFMPEAVFIFSSVVDVPTTIKNPLSVRSGVLSLMNAAELGVKYDVKLNVFASSGYVYGNANQLPYNEKTELDPVNPYNISKIFGENILNFYTQKYNLNTSIMRYAPTYGPRRKIGPIIDFISKALSNDPITLYGTVTRDYMFVEDAAYANLCALNKKTTGLQIFNIGTGIEVSLEQVYLLICDILKVKPNNIIKKKPINNEINRFCLDVNKAKSDLNFTFNHNLESGLIKTIDWVVRENLK